MPGDIVQLRVLSAEDGEALRLLDEKAERLRAEMRRIGAVLAVTALLLLAGYNQTPYYPSKADWQSSLTLANSASSYYTLRVMTYVSWLIPFVLAYIAYAWRAVDRSPLTPDELERDDHAY